jgi:RHH-type transcriptional regulator, rel operon repressor / antitoxin RelB
MSSTTVSVRIDAVIKKRLQKLAKSTGRSRSFLAAEAINEYLDLFPTRCLDSVVLKLEIAKM